MSTSLDATFEKPATLRARVASHLRAAILEGRLKGGERLREADICARLEISRPTLREALRTLEAEKLIIMEPHRGPSVVQLDERTARELYAMRSLLEPYAVREFTRLADDAARRRLQNAVADLHVAAAAGETAALLAAKAEFYEVLLDGCGNALVKETLNGLLSRVSRLRATSFARADRLGASLGEIDDIVERVLAGDADGAAQAASRHLEQARLAAFAVMATPG